MTDFEIASSTSSRDIIALARQLRNGQLRDKLLDSCLLKNRIPKERKTRFKIHPDSFSSSDSDTPHETYRNGFTDHLPCNETNSYEDKIPSPRKCCEREADCESFVKDTPNKAKQKSAEKARRKQIEAKLLVSLQKTDCCIGDISKSLDSKIPKPDGAADWEKRCTRSAEFSSRFQRNYLYQLTRQIEDVDKSKTSEKVLPSLTSAHQTLLQAFQAYHSHIPISLGDLVVDKLKAVVERTQQLCTLHETVVDESTIKKDLIHKIRTNCGTILSKANELTKVSENPSSKKRLAPKPALSPRKRCIRKKTLNDKLSMYSISDEGKKNFPWRKTPRKVNDAARDLPCIQSRYKTAGFKHRPPPVKSAPVKPKFFTKRALASIQETPLESPKNEDDVETMINIHEEKKNHCVHNGWDSAVLQVANLCNSLKAKEQTEVSQAQLEILLKNLMEMALSGKINSATNDRIGSHTPKTVAEAKTQNGIAHVKNGHCLEQSMVRMAIADSKKESTCSLQSQWKTLEVTGEKNAQLICIRDEGSRGDLPTNPHPSLATLSPDEVQIAATPVEKSESETVVLPAEMPKAKMSVKISRLQKQSKQKLTPLPKQQIKSILQGKLQHAKVMKALPMYCKSADQHPWEVVNKITHRLLEDILFGICKEIEVNNANIVQSLYNSEFM